MELFSFSEDIFEQQECMCISKIRNMKNSVITHIEERKENLNSHYETLKELAVNRMAVLKRNLQNTY